MLDYTCEHCGGEFVGDHDEDNALDECRDTFGFIPPEHERAVLCHECWKAMVAWAEKEGLTA